MKFRIFKYRYIALLVFFCAFIAQVFIWQYEYMLDVQLWSDQSMYFAQGDNRQFDAKAGYGHPGGPIILGTIFANKVFNVPFNINTVSYVMATLNALVITAISLLCFLLQKDTWWIATVGLLSINHSYFYSTPPSGLAALLATCLCLFTLFLYRKKHDEIKEIELLLLGFVSGVLVATRADIGVFLVLAFGLTLFIKGLKFRQGLFVCTSAFLSFVLFDPFMWKIPLLHIKDLIFKATFHYFDYRPAPIPLDMVLNVSALLLVSMALFVLAYFSRKKFKESFPIPFTFGWMLVLVTVGLYTIFLTSKYQAIRYFVPLIFIWEALLPPILFSWVSILEFKHINKNSLNIILTIALALYYIGEYLFRLTP